MHPVGRHVVAGDGDRIAQDLTRDVLAGDVVAPFEQGLRYECAADPKPDMAGLANLFGEAIDSVDAMLRFGHHAALGEGQPDEQVGFHQQFAVTQPGSDGQQFVGKGYA